MILPAASGKSSSSSASKIANKKNKNKKPRFVITGNVQILPQEWFKKTKYINNTYSE